MNDDNFTGKRPDYVVSVLIRPGIWKRVGAAWESKTTAGKPYFSISIDLLPVSGWTGKLTMFVNDDEKPETPKPQSRRNRKKDEQIPF